MHWEMAYFTYTVDLNAAVRIGGDFARLMYSTHDMRYLEAGDQEFCAVGMQWEQMNELGFNTIAKREPAQPRANFNLGCY